MKSQRLVTWFWRYINSLYVGLCMCVIECYLLAVIVLSMTSNAQKAQLSQRGRTTLRVFENLVKLFTWAHLKLHRYNFGKVLVSLHTKRMVLECKIDSWTTCLSVLTHYQTVTDRQTDRHFYDGWDRALQCIARQYSNWNMCLITIMFYFEYYHARHCKIVADF